MKVTHHDVELLLREFKMITDHDSIYDNMFDSYGCPIDFIREYTQKLLEHIEVGISPSSTESYKGFGVREDESIRMILKTSINK